MGRVELRLGLSELGREVADFKRGRSCPLLAVAESEGFVEAEVEEGDVTDMVRRLRGGLASAVTGGGRRCLDPAPSVGGPARPEGPSLSDTAPFVPV